MKRRTLIGLGLVLIVAAATVRPAAAQPAAAGEAGAVERIDPRFDALVAADATVERIADGFQFIEGPVWVGDAGDGHLLFSDIPADTVYRWSEADGTSVFLNPVFLPELETGGQGGSNGLTLDLDGRVVLCEHGNRRLARIEADGSRITLADRYDGQRLNSPNDIVYHSSGAAFFTDPPYGLASPEAAELDWNGVYRLDPDGSVHLLADGQTRPNGIGLSPDESTLYVANSDGAARQWMAYPVDDDLGVGEGRVLLDLTDSADRGGARRLRGRHVGEPVGERPRRHRGHQPGGRSSRHRAVGRAARERGVRQRRHDPLHDRADRPLQGPHPGRGPDALTGGHPTIADLGDALHQAALGRHPHREVLTPRRTKVETRTGSGPRRSARLGTEPGCSACRATDGAGRMGDAHPPRAPRATTANRLRCTPPAPSDADVEIGHWEIIRHEGDDSTEPHRPQTGPQEPLPLQRHRRRGFPEIGVARWRVRNERALRRQIVVGVQRISVRRGKAGASPERTSPSVAPAGALRYAWSVMKVSISYCKV